jgi:hypothetical protein
VIALIKDLENLRNVRDLAALLSRVPAGAAAEGKKVVAAAQGKKAVAAPPRTAARPRSAPPARRTKRPAARKRAR